MNDDERRQWVDNDERLYDLWLAAYKQHRTTQRIWVMRNRSVIDEYVARELSRGPS